MVCTLHVQLDVVQFSTPGSCIGMVKTTRRDKKFPRNIKDNQKFNITGVLGAGRVIN